MVKSGIQQILEDVAQKTTNVKPAQPAKHFVTIAAGDKEKISDTRIGTIAGSEVSVTSLQRLPSGSNLSSPLPTISVTTASR